MDCFRPFIVKKGEEITNDNYSMVSLLLVLRRNSYRGVGGYTYVDGLISETCLIALRGPVRQIRLDQGSSFVAVKNEFNGASLKELDPHDKIQRFLTGTHCEFVLNAPSASHAGEVHVHGNIKSGPCGAFWLGYLNYPHDPQIDCLEMATIKLWVVGCGGRGGNSDIPGEIWITPTTHKLIA